MCGPQENFALFAVRRPSQQTRIMTATEIGSHVVYAVVTTKRSKKENTETTLRVLLDSGTSSTIISGKYCDKLRQRNADPLEWNTKGGVFVTKHTAKVKF